MKKRTITIYDVAKKADVSMATVSRVVNGTGKVKEATRQKVQQIIKDMGYHPNAVARGLASQKTTTIGIFLPDLNNAYFNELAQGIDDVSKLYNYNIILMSSSISHQNEKDVLRSLFSQQVDGIVYMSYDISDEVCDLLYEKGIPTVLAGVVDYKRQLPSVNIDYKQATYDIMEKFAEYHDSIALVVQDKSTNVNRDFRCKGMAEAAKNHSTVQFEVIRAGYGYESGLAVFDELKAKDIQAVLTTDDSVAIGILNAANDRSIKVPEELEVMSAMNTKLALMARPELSSISQPLYDMGAVAMRMLTKLMKKEPVQNQQVILPHEIINRKSTK
ncbi:substrate-binding domain-containing protein [Holzapfeliella sp. He02]|uniref:Substrate-binding domain-containing protein n=1 Tax=Holzapfeliella saturejae TaxID=3082953 RepID=A0ABU8SH25_9LACO